MIYSPGFNRTVAAKPIKSTPPVHRLIGLLTLGGVVFPPKGGLLATDEPMTLASHEYRDKFFGRKGSIIAWGWSS